MFGIGIPELLIIMVTILIIFGAGKLPEIGAGMGKAIKNFKGATSEIENKETSCVHRRSNEKCEISLFQKRFHSRVAEFAE